MKGRHFISEISGRVREDFVTSRRVLTFDEYLDEVAARPGLLLRNAAQYLHDAILAAGRTRLDRAYGRVHRYGLFDMDAAGGRGRVVGQEEVQEAIFREIQAFVRQGSARRLILLHGPNGSAKTSLVQALAKALVSYSHAEDGLLYRFNWIFPVASPQGKRVGFGAGKGPAAEQKDSYAHLDPRDIAAAVPNELRDHPLFLLPRAARGELLEGLRSGGGLPEGFRLSDHLLHGDLGPMSRRIFDALLTAAGGDLAQVLRHVQVERFYLSRRYRRGIVTIEPQLHVDAVARQLTLEESYGNLPAVLRHLSFWQFSGDLVDGNRGMVEFSDLLKRPPESFKYLLSSTEKSAVPVGDSALYLDVVYLGTTNDTHLSAFKQSPDFPSFKGRLHLIRVPYLRDFTVEKGIYDLQIAEEAPGGRHVAPHATDVVALWGVLTRLRRPRPDLYPDALQGHVRTLSPMDKVLLYGERRVPPGVPPERRRDVLAIAPELYREWDDEAVCEGAFGASPRELKGVLQAAAADEEFACVHPLAVFRGLEELVRDPSLYQYLQIQPDEGYHDARGFIGDVRIWYAARVDDGVREALDLVPGGSFVDLLRRYASQVSAFLKGQRVVNPLTGNEEPPDEALMMQVEDLAGTGRSRQEARQQFLGRVAARSLERSGQPIDYEELFADLLSAMRASFHEGRRDEIAGRLRDVLEHLSGTDLPAERTAAAAAAVEALAARGYCRACIPPTLSFLLKERYPRH